MNKRIRKKIDKLTYHGIYPYLAMKEKKPVTYTTYRKYYSDEKRKGYSYYTIVLNSVKCPALLPYRFKKKAMLKISRRETMKHFRFQLNTYYGCEVTEVTDHRYDILKNRMDTFYHETVRKYILQNYFPIPPMGLSCCLNLRTLAIAAGMKEKRV